MKRSLPKCRYVAVRITQRREDTSEHRNAPGENSAGLHGGRVVMVVVNGPGRGRRIGGALVVIPNSGEHLAVGHLHLQQPVNLEFDFIQDVWHAVATAREDERAVRKGAG